MTFEDTIEVLKLLEQRLIRSEWFKSECIDGLEESFQELYRKVRSSYVEGGEAITLVLDWSHGLKTIIGDKVVERIMLVNKLLTSQVPDSRRRLITLEDILEEYVYEDIVGWSQLSDHGKVKLLQMEVLVEVLFVLNKTIVDGCIELNIVDDTTPVQEPKIRRIK